MPLPILTTKSGQPASAAEACLGGDERENLVHGCIYKGDVEYTQMYFLKGAVLDILKVHKMKSATLASIKSKSSCQSEVFPFSYQRFKRQTKEC
ncbi:MAG: hypothetical protein FWG10_01170 [Eubacteriaceae bacterium]|nr:hypothetical protein [Eubacteriaceae bacterium]